MNIAIGKNQQVNIHLFMYFQEIHQNKNKSSSHILAPV